MNAVISGFERLESRGQQVVEREGDEIGECADREQDRVSGSDVAEGMVAIEDTATEPREEEAADGAGHAAQSNDRSDVFLAEHVRHGGVEVGGPGLVC